MKILLGIGHPADVHLFKNFIIRMQGAGHEIFVAAREKEFTCYLLEHYDIPYHRISDHKKSFFLKAADYFVRWRRTYRLYKDVQPDIALGVGDFYLAQIGKLKGCPGIVLTDTESAVHDALLTFPFAACILTPKCYKTKIPKHQIRYDSYHELAYLHPVYFEPSPMIYEQLDLARSQKYVVLRFVDRSALHDIGIKGLSMEFKRTVVHEFLKYVHVFISSEPPLPDDLQRYALPIFPENIHHALYYAELLFGESATMASESAVLGTPSVYLDKVGRGYTDEAQEYGLVFNYKNSQADQENAIQKGLELLNNPNLNREMQQNRQRFLENKIDVTAFLVWFIENYPESKRIMQDNPDYQYNFR